MQSLQDLSRMSTYVIFFPDLSPQAYECGCRIDEPTGTITIIIIIIIHSVLFLWVKFDLNFLENLGNNI